MSKGTRIFLGVGATAVLVMMMFVGAAAAAVYQAGTIAVDVHDENGTDISVTVPAGLANVAIALVPAEPFREISDEIPPGCPSLRDVIERLGDQPDFVLFEYSGHGEQVRIEKRGGKIIIRVDGGSEVVHVSVPLATAKRVARKLDRFLDT